MFLTKQKKNSKKINSKKNNEKNNTKNNKQTIKRQNGRQKGGAGAGLAHKDLAKKQNFKYINIKDNGWCFYYAILQGLSDNPDTPATIEEGKQFLVEIADWFRKNKDTIKSIIQDSWEKFITSTDITVKNEISGPDTTKKFDNYNEFLETLRKTQKNKTEDHIHGFDDPGPLIWGDLDIFGQAIADIKNTNLILYEIKNNILQKKQHTLEISPQTVTPDTKTINLVYINGNHFDLLVPNTTPPPPDPPLPLPTTKPKISFCYA